MANLDVQIQDLVGTAMTDQTAMDTFLSDGLAQLYSFLPASKLVECSTSTTLSNSPTTLDLDTATIGRVTNVVRKDVKGYSQTCRQIHASMSSRITDPSDLMHVTDTDPVYFINNAVLNVYPDPTASQTADISYIPYPSAVLHTATSIDNLPNEVEHIVVLYAAIKALESLAVDEEDPELYLPVIQNLKQDYSQGLQTLGVVQAQPQPQAQGAR